MEKREKTICVYIDANTETLKAKLRAISKHATNLVNELQEIEDAEKEQDQ